MVRLRYETTTIGCKRTGQDIGFNLFPPTFFSNNFKMSIASLATDMRFMGFNEETIKRFIDKIDDVEDYHTLQDMLIRYKEQADLYGDSQE